MKKKIMGERKIKRKRIKKLFFSSSGNPYTGAGAGSVWGRVRCSSELLRGHLAVQRLEQVGCCCCCWPTLVDSNCIHIR